MSKKLILLVEDNPDDTELTIRAFRRHQIQTEIVSVEDGQQAIDYLRGRGAYADRDLTKQPSLVLLDLNLPKVNGLDVLRSIRSTVNTARLPVVVLTSSNADNDLAKAYEYRANSYIRKPVDFVKFVEAIKTVGMYWLVFNEPPPYLGGDPSHAAEAIR